MRDCSNANSPLLSLLSCPTPPYPPILTSLATLRVESSPLNPPAPPSLWLFIPRRRHPHRLCLLTSVVVSFSRLVSFLLHELCRHHRRRRLRLSWTRLSLSPTFARREWLHCQGRPVAVVRKEMSEKRRDGGLTSSGWGIYSGNSAAGNTSKSMSRVWSRPM
jgi:hypothetical protein